MAITIAEASEIVTAGATVAVALGGAITFLWARVETANRRITKQLEECRNDRMQSRERRAILIVCIEFLQVALGRHEPHAPELEQTKVMIRDLKEREAIAFEMEKRT